MTRNTNTGVRGIYKRNDNRFEANVSVKRKRSNRSLSVHIGNYPTLDLAIIGRKEYISKL